MINELERVFNSLEVSGSASVFSVVCRGEEDLPRLLRGRCCIVRVRIDTGARLCVQLLPNTRSHDAFVSKPIFVFFQSGWLCLHAVCMAKTEWAAHFADRRHDAALDGE